MVTVGETREYLQSTRSVTVENRPGGLEVLKLFGFYSVLNNLMAFKNCFSN